MQIIYIYEKSTLNLITKIPANSIEEFQKRPIDHFPLFSDELHIISDMEYQNPKIENDEIREKNKKELFLEGKYPLGNNEILKDGEIISVNLTPYEKIVDGSIFKDLELLKLKKLNDLSGIKDKKIEEGFKVKIKSKILSCRTRQNDQTNIQALVLAQIPKIDFKFKDENIENDIIVEITQPQIKILFSKGLMFISKNIAIELNIKEKINTLSVEELENLNIEEEYLKLLGDEVVEL